MFNKASTVERLKQMRAKANNAFQAETLLRQLVVFHPPFGQSAVEAMVLIEMLWQERTEAFATLRS